MQLYNLLYENETGLQRFIQTHEISSYSNILVQIFYGIDNIDNSSIITQTIKTLLPQSHILGITTSGEIANAHMYDKKIVISFSLFEKTRIASQLYRFEDSFEIEKIHQDLIADDTVAMVVFSDGLKSDAESFIKELHTKNPKIIIAGGRAGDNAQFASTYVFNEKDITQKGCVIATLSSKSLYVHNDYMLNWTPIGKEMLVTKAEGNVLYELDHIPIIDVYRKYLGDDVVKDLPRSCMSFPLILQKESVCVARDPVQVRGEAMVYAGNFEVGDVVRFSFANIEDLTDNLGDYFQTLMHYPAEAVYVYSCTARKALLEEKLLDELSVLESLAPSVGFFTYGEFFQSQKFAEILNVTTTFMMLSESKNTGQKVLKEIKAGDFDPIKKALTHLVKVTTQELEHLSTHDVLTTLYNRNEYLKVINKKIKSAKRYGEDFGLIVIDLDHFKLVNDTYGHNTGDKVLVAFANVLKNNVREDDFVGRWGGEEFIIIVNHATKSGLEALVKKLQREVAKIHIGPIDKISASYGITMFKPQDTDESLFKRADTALYIAKQTGRDRYIFK